MKPAGVSLLISAGAALSACALPKEGPIFPSPLSARPAYVDVRTASDDGLSQQLAAQLTAMVGASARLKSGAATAPGDIVIRLPVMSIVDGRLAFDASVEVLQKDGSIDALQAYGSCPPSDLSVCARSLARAAEVLGKPKPKRKP